MTTHFDIDKPTGWIGAEYEESSKTFLVASRSGGPAEDRNFTMHRFTIEEFQELTTKMLDLLAAGLSRQTEPQPMTEQELMDALQATYGV